MDSKPIATAPADADLELSIYDEGEYHALVFPCRREGSSWRDVGANRLMPLNAAQADALAAMMKQSFVLTKPVGSRQLFVAR